MAALAVVASALLAAAEPPAWIGVEIHVRVVGRGEAESVALALPPSDGRQSVQRFAVEAGGLLPTMEERDGLQLAGVEWPHPAAEQRFVVRFRARASAVSVPVKPVAEAEPVPAEMERHLRPSRHVPSRSPLVRQILRDDVGDPKGDAVKAIYDFVVRSIAVEPAGAKGALEALRDRKAKESGVERAFCALLRAAGFAARPALGLDLALDHGDRTRRWTEVWLGSQWVPVSPSNRWYGMLRASSKWSTVIGRCSRRKAWRISRTT
jgi:transglutaminase-like putative cysteine protease